MASTEPSDAKSETSLPPWVPSERANAVVIPLTDFLTAGLKERWTKDVVPVVQDFKQTLVTNVDSAIRTTTSGLSQLVVASSEALDVAKEKLEIGKSHYAAAEQEAIWKIKEGIAVAAAHPAISCGAAAGLSLILLKRPRRALIRNTRRIFLSDESLISNFQAKVKEMEQSVNLMKNESVKLLNRATQAEAEIKRAQTNLKTQGNLIQKELQAANRIERQIMGLKDRISELPKREISGFQSKVSAYASQVKQEKKVLNGALSKIINHGIAM